MATDKVTEDVYERTDDELRGIEDRLRTTRRRVAELLEQVTDSRTALRDRRYDSAAMRGRNAVMRDALRTVIERARIWKQMPPSLRVDAQDVMATIIDDCNVALGIDAEPVRQT